jgi:hypothetical protein
MKIDEQSIKLAIENYNNHFKPASVAELKEIGDNSVKVEFSGPFCQNCGIEEYFDDFRDELEKMKIDTDVGEIKESISKSFIVEFVLKKNK